MHDDWEEDISKIKIVLANKMHDRQETKEIEIDKEQQANTARQYWKSKALPKIRQDVADIVSKLADTGAHIEELPMYAEATTAGIVEYSLSFSNSGAYAEIGFYGQINGEIIVEKKKGASNGGIKVARTAVEAFDYRPLLAGWVKDEVEAI